MPQLVDEETPLLSDPSQIEDHQRKNPKPHKTPLPWRQFSILVLLQISEPISAQVIAPFLPQLIKDIGITDGKDSRIGYYVGIMHALFFLTEACTIFHWSRMSDQIGRRPVLLTGLAGLTVSLWCFGLSKTFWGLILSRCLNGALNGNVGVMKSMTVEMTDPTNFAQAYSILPVTWSFGTSVGPLIGGSLVRPVERFPEIFGNSTFLEEYPYLLPCAVAATVTGFSWLIAFLFLKETVKKPRMTAWKYLCGGTEKAKHGSQTEPNAVDKQIPLRALLIRPVLTAAGNYAAYSFTEMAFRSIVPVFYAMPIEMGGLNLDPPTIGNILGLLGISSGVTQYLGFVRIHDWLGAKNVYLLTVSLYFPMIALFPVINAVARVYGMCYLVWCLVVLQMTLFVFAYFAFAVSIMYIGAAAPNKASIGATNGFAQTIVSVMRAFGPATVNTAYSISIEKDIMGGYLGYWVMVAMVGLTMWVGYLLPSKMWNE